MHSYISLYLTCIIMVVLVKHELLKEELKHDELRHSESVRRGWDYIS